MKLTDNAEQVLEKRYYQKDVYGRVIENWEELCKRVVKEIIKAETEKLREKFYKLFYNLIVSRDFLPNSPTLRNCGANNGCLSACFSFGSIGDSRREIFETLADAVEVQAFGGGTGYDFSLLRPEGSSISTTKGVSCGPIGFAKVYNVGVGDVIAQGGVRHGAQLGVLRIDHPDIIKFIESKKTEDQLTNFNISVAVTNEFMNKLIENPQGFDWDLKFNDKVYKTINGKELWDLIIKNSWENGEPGIIFIDRVNELNPLKKFQTITAPNPCQEATLSAYESCNLGSINLSNHVILQHTGYFVDWEKLRKTIKISVRFLDNIITVNNFPLLKIKEQTLRTRKVGLGVMGWADMLIKLHIVYGSKESIDLAKELMRFINETAWEYSTELVEEKGSLIIDGEDLGRRNGILTIIAPTGTLSLISNCSAGIEPVFSFEFTKKCIDKELIVKHPLLEEWFIKTNYQLPYDIPKYFIESKDIPIEQHIKMQAAFQENTDGSISKTINAPCETTIEQVDESFKLAYNLGVKGITFYRQGSREYEAQTAIISEPKSELKQVSKNLYPDQLIRKMPFTIKTDKGFITLNKSEKPIQYSKNGIESIDVTKDSPFKEFKLEVNQTYSDPNDVQAQIEKDNLPEDILDPPEWMIGGRQMIKTGEGTLWVHLFENPETGDKELWSQISKEGRTLSSMNAAIGRLGTLALKKGASWEDIEKQLRGIIGEKTAWSNGEQVLSPPDGIAKVIRKRILNNPDWPIKQVCQHSSEEEQLPCKQPVGGSSPSAGSKYQSQDEIDAIHNFGHREAEKFLQNSIDLCPDCASPLLHDEGCKGGRCQNCGWSNCS